MMFEKHPPALTSLRIAGLGTRAFCGKFTVYWCSQLQTHYGVCVPLSTYGGPLSLCCTLSTVHPENNAP